MNELLTKCAKEFFSDYVQTREYIENANNLPKTDKNLAECKEIVDNHLRQLREKEGYEKFNDIDIAIEGQKCELEKFGFINGFVFAAQLLSK